MAKGKLPVNKLPTAKVTAAPASYKPSKQELDRERRWKAEDACRTLEQAAKIKNDPQLMADAKQVAQERISDLKKVR
jgi:hypothetical protein